MCFHSLKLCGIFTVSLIYSTIMSPYACMKNEAKQKRHCYGCNAVASAAIVVWTMYILMHVTPFYYRAACNADTVL